MAPIGKGIRDDKLVTLLAAGHTVVFVAKETGVGERTIRRRLTDLAFRQRIEEIRSATFERGVAMLTSTMPAAIATLIELLHAESEAVRLGAVRCALETGCRLRESLSLEQRIAEIEAQLADGDHGQRWRGAA